MSEESFPLFDAHMHFSHAYLDQILASYRLYGVVGGVNSWGADLRGACEFRTDFGEYLAVMRERKLANFRSLWWPSWKEFGWRPQVFVKKLCADMRRYAEMGAVGIKVWKDLGMYIIHPDWRAATMDEPELTPVWETALDLDWWVVIHQTDPSRAWKNIKTGLSREELWQRRDAVLSKYPGMRVMMYHNGNDAEGVNGWAALMEKYPRMLAGMDRDPLQYDDPATVRAFLEKYADRVLFGADMSMTEERPPDDAWTIENIYGPWRRRLRALDLSDATFRKITRENGERYFLQNAPVGRNQ